MPGSTTLIDGIRDGAIATAAMSAVMLAGDRAGLMPEPPPTTITRDALEEVGVDRPALIAVAAPAAHLAFGALGGALYVALRRVLPGPGWLLGILFGLSVWAVSYKGWIPGLGILPPPEHDRPGRPAVMIAAHVVYGIVLGRLGGSRRV